MQLPHQVLELGGMATCPAHHDANHDDGHQQERAQRDRDGLEQLLALGCHQTASRAPACSAVAVHHWECPQPAVLRTPTFLVAQRTIQSVI